MTTINMKQGNAIGKGLRDFGYDGVTDKECMDKANAILAGNGSHDIISMFIKSFLEEAGIK